MIWTKTRKMMLFLSLFIFLTSALLPGLYSRGAASLPEPSNGGLRTTTSIHDALSPILSRHESKLTLQQAPSVQILNPTTNETIGDFVTVRFKVDSDTEITDTEIYLNDTILSNSSGITHVNQTYYYYFDADAENLNGTYILKIRAQNQNGWGEDTVTVHFDPSYQSGTVKVLSYNIWETGRDPDWKTVVKEENPDIAILIETGAWIGGNDSNFRAVVDEFNQYFSNETPYQANATQIDKTSTAGEALLSRYPIIRFYEFKYALLDDGSERKLHHSVYDAIIEINEIDVHVIAVHLACCEGGLNSRLLDMEALINYMDSLGDVPIIFAGDFNSHSPEDVGDLAPNRGNLGTEPIEMLLNNDHPHGSTVHVWHDAYRTLNPYDPGYTYVDSEYRSRIDYIFVNQYFLDKVDLLVNATVADTPTGKTGSDHYPVDVTLNFDSPEIDLRPPVQAIGLNGTILNDTAVSLSWIPNNETDLSHYNIYRNNVLIGNTSSTSFIDADAIAGEVLRYQVAAVDVNGNIGMKSKAFLVNTTYGIIRLPAAPTIQLEVNKADNKSIIISWTINDTGGITPSRFNIYRLSRGEYYLIATVPGNHTSYVDTRVRTGKNYTYRVSAVNEVGEGPMSEPVSITIPAPGGTTGSTTTTNATTTSSTTTAVTTPVYLESSVLTLFLVGAIMIHVRIRTKRKK